MYAFEYAKPGSVADATATFSGADDGTYLAGGQTLIPTMKQRLAMPSDLIDLSGIDEMKGICPDDGGIAIGAMTCHADVAASEEVNKTIPALAALAGVIGDPAVRNRGTLGGSIANNDPASDYPGALLALDATVKTSNRTIGAEDFFTGMFETALEDGELILSVTFKRPDRAAYAKFRNPASRYPVVGAFVAQFGDQVRVAITGAAPCAFRSAELEQALSADFSPDAARSVKISADGMNGDLHASPEYRASLVPVMTARAVSAALAG